MVYDLATAERVRHLLADRADVAERKMMGGLCFMAKGGMCCVVSGRGGLLVRVGPVAAELVERERHVQAVVMGGRPAKDFVRVTPEGYRTTPALRKWLRRGLDFVATLPPKITNKPRRR